VKVLFLTNEYPPHIYGGAGVHVGYLTRELAKTMPATSVLKKVTSKSRASNSTRLVSPALSR